MTHDAPLKGVISGLKYHSLLAVTLHGIRAYTDLRTDKSVMFGLEEAEIEHLEFLQAALSGKNPDIKDYGGPLMSPTDIDTLLAMDFETLYEMENADA